MFRIIVAVCLILTIVLPVGAFFISERKASNFKTSLKTNIFSFFGVLFLAGTFMATGNVQAAETVTAAADVNGLGLIAAALAVGISGIGAGIAVAAGSSAAIGALSENDSIMGKAMIFVALGEGIALYGLVIAFMILGKV